MAHTDLDHKEVSFICENCGDEFSLNEGETPYNEGDGPMCDDCHREHYETFCVVCEEHFDTPTGDEPNHMFINRPYNNLKPGIYLVVDTPVYSCDLFGDNFHLYKDSLKLVRPIQDETLKESGDCCPYCAAGTSDIFKMHTMSSGKQQYGHGYDSKGRLISHWCYPVNLLQRGDKIEVKGELGEVVYRKRFPYISWRDQGKYKGVGREEKTIIHIQMENSGKVVKEFFRDSNVGRVDMTREKPLSKAKFKGVVNIEED